MAVVVGVSPLRAISLS
ncbi:hypothetical protein E2C01_029818 [Portunus trituberculatus]|uniref:Uncharacterized protein n=1 Tax=Portunus trituberculatus TaxID=210409 RepID=A0A5B7ETY4_PORTR|nr:hypothetical protein [Portunus trituberculatus]